MKSWIDSANTPDSGFPIQNLPYGVYSIGESPHHCCVAIGEHVVDLAALESASLLGTPGDLFAGADLTAFMASGHLLWNRVRDRLTDLLRADGDAALRDDPALRASAILPRAEVTLHLPFRVAGYTDFYAGRHHAQNVGTIFRGAENALPANWLSIPIGYNGRASTVVVGGTPVRRPLGQMKQAGEDLPVFGPTRKLDFELELGAVIGTPSRMGEPISVAQADAMIFGYVLLNDWSARDIQAWETVPLGPFQGKAFATSISPWIVTKAALEPFRVASPPRDRPLLPYLREPGKLLYDIALEAHLRPAEAAAATRLCLTNYRDMYYAAAQQIAHHAVGGCKMNTGDLIGSGTISGPTRENRGSLLELSWNGSEPVTLATGETRTFLVDGDTLILSGCARGQDYTIGFGTCEGTILPAPKELDW